MRLDQLFIPAFKCNNVANIAVPRSKHKKFVSRYNKSVMAAALREAEQKFNRLKAALEKVKGSGYGKCRCSLVWECKITASRADVKPNGHGYTNCPILNLNSVSWQSKTVLLP